MKIGVLAVQGAVTEHLNHLKKCGIETVAVKDSESLNKTCGLIIPGGESTTIGKLIEIFGLAPDPGEKPAGKPGRFRYLCRNGFAGPGYNGRN